MRRSPPRAAQDAAPDAARPDGGTPGGREERLAGLVRTALAGLRALGSRLAPEPAAADGARHGLRWPNRRAATAIFVSAYLFFLVVILAGQKLMPGLLNP